jgi:peptide/nickel transport system ATP-binding protein
MMGEGRDNENSHTVKSILSVKNLVTEFYSGSKVLRILNKVSLELYEKEIYGIIGESGTGKTVLAESLMDIISPEGRISEGEIFLDDFNLLYNALDARQIRKDKKGNIKIITKKRLLKEREELLSKIRGKRISMVFENIHSSLDPNMTLGEQIEESVISNDTQSLADSVIKRQYLESNEIINFLDSYNEKRDEGSKRNFLRLFLINHGIEENYDHFQRSLQNGKNMDDTLKSLLGQITKDSKKFNEKRIVKIREYYELKNIISQAKFDIVKGRGTQNSIGEEKARVILKESKRLFLKHYIMFHIMLSLFRESTLKVIREEARRRASLILKIFNIGDPESILQSFPNEVPEGIKQLISIGIGTISNPSVLIADEPTTALDVISQARILGILRDLRDFFNISILFMSHDISLMANLCNRIGVLYLGNIVEESSTLEIFNNAKHPYTIGLINSSSRADIKKENEIEVEILPGNVPKPDGRPSGCSFHIRCQFAMDVCSLKKPTLVEVSKNHRVACFLYSNKWEVE